jgi:hypothetical protein
LVITPSAAPANAIYPAIFERSTCRKARRHIDIPSVRVTSKSTEPPKKKVMHEDKNTASATMVASSPRIGKIPR